MSQIGVCTSIENHELLRKSGCSYIEEGVRRFLISDQSAAQFQENLHKLRNSSIPIRACNSFLPGNMKSVGHNAVRDEILAFSEVAFQRAKKSGIDTIVFGSGSSRRIPDGFDRQEARQQFIKLLRNMGLIARKYNVVIAIEPLNSMETNFINSVSEGAEIVKQIDHPNIQLLADIYHMMKEDESPQEIVKAGKFIHHIHIAEKENRTPPGVAGDDFRPYLSALKKINYQGRISIECRWSNLQLELPVAVAYLRKQIDEVDL